MTNYKRASLTLLAALTVLSSASAHRIVLIDRDWVFDSPSLTNIPSADHDFWGDLPNDNALAIRLWFLTDYTPFIFTAMSGTGAAQQVGYCRFTLEWIPDPDAADDVPGDGVYSLNTDVFATMATDARVSSLWYPPGTGSSDTTLQTWLLSLQSSYSDSAPCTAPTDADGCPFSQFPSDPQAYRQLASANYGASVSFDLVNGRYIGIADVASTYQASFGFTATGGSISTGHVSNHSGLIIRTIAKSCAGVNVESP